jgi:hypothetical protein
MRAKSVRVFIVVLLIERAADSVSVVLTVGGIIALLVPRDSPVAESRLKRS